MASKGGLTIKGPGLKKLRALGVKLEGIERVRVLISKSMAAESEDLIRDGFSKEQNPYGQKWKKRKRETRRTAGKPVLSRDGLLKNSFSTKSVTAHGFVVSSDRGYASAHQRPKRGKRPQRAMVPITGKGVPSRWRKPLRDAADDAIKLYMGSK